MAGTSSEYWNRVANSAVCATPLSSDLLTASGLSKEAARVLDAGCGSGRILAELASLGWTHLWGIDYSAGMVRLAQAKLQDRGLVSCGHLSQLPFETSFFDLVCFLGVLNCIPDDRDLRRSFEEMARVLSPGGYLLLSDFEVGLSDFDRRRYLTGLLATGHYGMFFHEDQLFRHRSEATVIGLLTDLFEVVSTERGLFRSMLGNERLGYSLLARCRTK